MLRPIFACVFTAFVALLPGQSGAEPAIKSNDASQDNLVQNVGSYTWHYKYRSHQRWGSVGYGGHSQHNSHHRHGSHSSYNSHNRSGSHGRYNSHNRHGSGGYDGHGRYSSHNRHGSGGHGHGRWSSHNRHGSGGGYDGHSRWQSHSRYGSSRY